MLAMTEVCKIENLSSTRQLWPCRVGMGFNACAQVNNARNIGTLFRTGKKAMGSTYSVLMNIFSADENEGDSHSSMFCAPRLESIKEAY